MVAVGCHSRAAQRAAAVHADSIRALIDRGAHPAESLGHARNPVTLLHAQLGGPRDDRPAFGLSCDRQQRRDLVDRRDHLFRSERHRPKGMTGNPHRAVRFQIGLRQLDLDGRPHGLEDPEEGRSRGIEAHPLDRDRPARAQGGCGHPERGGRKVTGHGQLDRVERPMRRP